MTCNACNQTIYDRLMSKTSPDNKIWHSGCLKCCECNKLLDSKYFETSGRLYCRNDYLAYYGPSCFSCANKITDEQYFFSVTQQNPSINSGDPSMHHQPRPPQNSNRLFFHDKCFACSYCARPLQKGDKYCILDTNPGMPNKTIMICHDTCTFKYQSSASMTTTNSSMNNNSIQVQNNNSMHAGNQLIQPVHNNPAPRAKRGRMKQNRPA